MYVNVAVLKETQPHERRVALTPSVVPKLIKLDAKLHMQSGAGNAIKLNDAAFKDVAFIGDRKTLVSDADVVLAVQPPALDVIDAMKQGAILISIIYAEKEPALVQRLLDKKITCFAMERIPRTTRAQSMDALSSQSALAGYYAVQLGSTHLARILPKITSAAGAIGPARVLVMGLGVAGLEAIATAHRLGAVVDGYDVRPETEDQAKSLGATFVETGVDPCGHGGYARALTAEEQGKVAADAYAVAPHVGRGGWTSYTGPAGWMQRAGLESILGLRLPGDVLYLDPCIPKTWTGFEISLRHGSARYELQIENPDQVRRGIASAALDQAVIETRPLRLLLADDGGTRELPVRFG